MAPLLRAALAVLAVVWAGTYAPTNTAAAYWSNPTWVSVTFDAPSSGAVLSGTVGGSGCQVDVQPRNGVASVAFFVDGTRFAVDSSSPWTCTLDTRGYTDGRHTLSAVATLGNGATGHAAVAVDLANGRPPASPSSQSCGGPVTISTGGTYSGCWVSDGQGVAVTVDTTSPVTITNSTIKGTTRLLTSGVAHTKLTVTHTTFEGRYPGGQGRWGGYSVWLDQFDYLVFEHNRIERKGGVKLNNWTGYPTAHPVLVRYNTAHDIDGRYTDGNGGYQSGTAYYTQFLQFDTVRDAPGVDVSWNDVVNDPDSSRVEDVISMFASSGTADSPIDVHDNLLQGAYPYPATYDRFSGGGISLGDNGGSHQVAHDNTVVSGTASGVYISSGTDNSIYRNTVVDTGTLPDGTRLPTDNVGVYVWNEYPQHAWGDNQAYDNVVGWMDASGHRNDWWLPDCSGGCSNTHLHDDQQPVTWTDVDDAVAAWWDRLSSRRLTVGP